MDVPLGIASVLGSCCGCMVLVELLAKEDKGCMNLMTFSTFLFISIEGLVSETKFFTVKNRIPLKGYAATVVLFFTVSVINNLALSFHVPVPLHIIFRSGSLLANMLLGMWILNKRYSIQKYASVVLITIGIIICTLATSGTATKEAEKDDKSHDHSTMSAYVEWIVGVAMLWFALFFSALLGITQEKMYTTYGKHPKEALFYCHFLSLPGFVFMAKDIYNHAILFSASEPLSIPLVNAGVPKLWVYLFLCDIAQYFCIRSVYSLTAECSSLTVTLVVTLRKFISLLVSIIYFKNPFTLYHWIGTVLVFGGTLVFSDIVGQVKQAFKPRQKTE